MTRAACDHRASFAIAIALFGLGWNGSDVSAASSSIEGVAQTRAMYLHLREVGPLTLTRSGEGLCLQTLAEEELDRGREAIQLAGPVRRTARRTSRRTSRRQEIIYD